jgi:hypothetical protein
MFEGMLCYLLDQWNEIAIYPFDALHKHTHSLVWISWQINIKKSISDGTDEIKTSDN